MSNKYLADLYKRVNDRYSIDKASMTTGDWIVANTKIKGRKFSFDEYTFQKAIADDMHRNLCCIKPSQVGMTEVQIRKALAFITRNRSTTLIFSFPDDDMRKRNSQTRIDPLVTEEKVFNPEYGSDKPVRSIGLIQIASSFMHVTGSKESDSTSTSADVVFNDEIDLTDQEMLALFASRLQGSKYRIRQQFSTPTYSGYGVDLQFENSDQMHYMVKCDCCNHWQHPEFTQKFIRIPGLSSDINDLREIDQGMMDRGLNLETAHVACEKCNSPLDLGRWDNRSWVAKHPGRTHSRGYKVTPFGTRLLTVQYIIEKLLEFKLKDALHRFENTVIGQAVDTSNNRLSEQEIKACMTVFSEVPAVNKDIPTWIGGDIGITCHLVIGQGYTVDDIKVVKMFTVPATGLLEAIQLIMTTYNVVGGILDRHPYTPTVEAIRDATQGVVVPCEYRGTKELNIITDHLDKVLHVQADRTGVLDAVAKAIRGKKISFAGYGNHGTVLVTHFRNMVREEEAEKPAEWRKLNPQDHYFHATGFMLVAVKMKKLKRETIETPNTSVAVVGVANPVMSTNMLGVPSRSGSKSTLTPWGSNFVRH